MSTQNKKDCSSKPKRRVNARRSHHQNCKTSHFHNGDATHGASNRYFNTFSFCENFICIRLLRRFFGFKSNRFMILVFIPHRSKWKHIAIRTPHWNGHHHHLRRRRRHRRAEPRKLNGFCFDTFAIWYGYSGSSPFIPNDSVIFLAIIVSFDLVTSTLVLLCLIELSDEAIVIGMHGSRISVLWTKLLPYSIFSQHLPVNSDCENWTKQHYYFVCHWKNFKNRVSMKICILSQRWKK